MPLTACFLTPLPPTSTASSFRPHISHVLTRTTTYFSSRQVLCALHPRRLSLPSNSSPATQWRQVPTSHTGCHSPHPSDENQSQQPTSAPLAFLDRVAHLLHSPRAAAAAAICLIIAAVFHVLRYPLVLIRFPLAITIILTALPAFASTTTRLIRSRMQTIDVDVLMSLAAAVCIATGVIFEGALLTTLYAVSHAAEQWTSRRATRELDSLRDTTPTVALRLASPTATEHTPVPVESIRKGDFVLVKSGELLPCDGQVALGSAFVSMPHITGEATPRRVTIGNTLPAGTRTADAPLVIRVTEVGAESSLARIARLVTAAQENRPRVSRFFDRFGQLYTRSVLIISFTLAAAMPIVTSILSPLVKPVSYAGRNGSAARALSFLVAASPCALVIGAPVAYLAALSACAKRGILAKSGAKSLEAASRVSHVVFDKTGTLTTGQLTLTSAATLPPDSFSNRNSTSNTSYLLNLERASSTVGCLEELEKEDLVRVVSAAAALERGAVHPIATAVQKRAKQLGAPIPQVHQTKVIAGQGVSGVLALNGNDGEQKTSPGVFGRPSYILGDGSSLLKDITRQASWQGETLSVLELDRKKYLFRFKDEIRVESQNLVQSLKQRGVQVSVLTGDAAGAAEFVSSAVGGGVKVFSNATPDGKLEHVTKLQDTLNDTNKGILMVGDGVNDAAALAASLVGVSCGLSSATAVHAADVVLVREELSNIVWFLEKSRRTKAVVLQNYALALGLMVLSAVACIGGAVPLWLAVTLHEGGTVLVGMNGLRLLRDS